MKNLFIIPSISFLVPYVYAIEILLSLFLFQSKHEMRPVQKIAYQIFKVSLESVKPEALVSNALHRVDDLLYVNGREYTLDGNVKVIGFGKAVYGMAVGLSKALSDHVTRGVISVPHDTSFLYNSNHFENIRVMEGARNNLPDEDSLRSAVEIEKFVRYDVTKSDLLIILISGGGSALLPSPVSEISLTDKLQTIKQISNNGGTIQQLNTMRKNLSKLKGGKLAALSRTQNIISLVISDIVGDPLDLIASGPTVFDQSNSQECLSILNELNITRKIPENVMTYLNTSKADSIVTKDVLVNCNNVLVGTNAMLLKHAAEVASEYGLNPFIISKSLDGDAKIIGENFGELIIQIIDGKYTECADFLSSNFQMPKGLLTKEDICEKSLSRKLCFIFGGETTVQVQGSGKGGRNQHIVLSALYYLQKAARRKPNLDISGIEFLSAGTDGQDGPTDATGAFLDENLLEECMDVDINGYLENCGSYDFFTSSVLTSGYLLKTGLTGTNVMDIQLLIVHHK